MDTHVTLSTHFVGLLCPLITTIVEPEDPEDPDDDFEDDLLEPLPPDEDDDDPPPLALTPERTQIRPASKRSGILSTFMAKCSCYDEMKGAAIEF